MRAPYLLRASVWEILLSIMMDGFLSMDRSESLREDKTAEACEFYVSFSSMRALKRFLSEEIGSNQAFDQSRPIFYQHDGVEKCRRGQPHTIAVICFRSIVVPTPAHISSIRHR